MENNVNNINDFLTYLKIKRFQILEIITEMYTLLLEVKNDNYYTKEQYNNINELLDKCLLIEKEINFIKDNATLLEENINAR